MPAPYITHRMRAIHNQMKACAFKKLINSECAADGEVGYDVRLRKYLGNAEVIRAMGDAKPNHDTATPLDALVVTDPTPEEKRAWGVDERSTRVIWVLTSDFDSNSITNRDLITVDSVPHTILGHTRALGMGHETFTTRLDLTRRTQVPE